jgi:hypothetical protein
METTYSWSDANPLATAKDHYLRAVAEYNEGAQHVEKFHVRADDAPALLDIVKEMPVKIRFTSSNRHRVHAVYARDDKIEVLLSYEGRDRLILNIHAPDQNSCDKIVELVKTVLEPYQKAEEGQHEISYWYRDNYTTSRRMRIHAPTLEQIRANYSAPVYEGLAKLTDKNRLSGIHIWHGPPGTGKTTAIRALGRALDGNTHVHLITDPSQLMEGNIGYLMEIVDDMDSYQEREHLIVMEDAGALISGQSHVTSEALGRILNITDGIIGQNFNISLLLTVNEKLKDIHPALTRPGRAASLVSFNKMTTEESNSWLQSHGSDTKVDKPQSIAELYALANNDDAVRVDSTNEGFGFLS